MKSLSSDGPRGLLCRGWLAALLAGVILPATAVLLADARAGAVIAPVLAVALMGAGMIAAAVAGRLWAGVAAGLVAAAGLALLAHRLGMAPPAHPVSAAFACLVASISFAARGALFARSAGARGWWIALAVVGGEGAMVATAWAAPDALPRWLLALLPAQWASTAIHNALAGGGTGGAGAVLLALGGTAATTLLVAALWPRRWPYLLMFGAWLGLSALVYHSPSPSPPLPSSPPPATVARPADA